MLSRICPRWCKLFRIEVPEVEDVIEIRGVARGLDQDQKWRKNQ